MKKIVSIVVLSALSMSMYAQQQQQFSLFQFFKQGFNPGYVGSTGMLSGTLDYRNQWVKTDGAPTSFNVGVHSLLSGSRSVLSNHGVGVLFHNDQIGVSSNNSVALQYAYRVNLTKRTKLSFGLQSTLLQSVTNYDALVVADNPDPIANGSVTSNSMNIGAGLYLYHENYFAGISSPALFRNTKDISGNLNPQANKNHYYLMGGVVAPVNNQFKLRLTSILKSTILDEGNTPAIADFNVAAIFADRFLLGASYRTDNTVLAMVQLQLTRALNVAYGYDFNTANLGRPAGVSHEIVLGFNLVAKNAAFTTPRFISYF